IGCGLGRMKVTKQRADGEQAMKEGVKEVMPKLENRTAYQATIAQVAPLLGPPGTTIGLIAAFGSVANADPAEKSALLSQSISIAMNTTAFGLIAAIPLLIANTVITKKTRDIIDSIEMASIKFLNVMTLNRAIEAGAPK